MNSRINTECEPETRTTTWNIFSADRAAVRLYDGLADGQAESHATGLGCCERFEERRLDFRTKPGPVIGNGYADITLRTRRSWRAPLARSGQD